MEDVGAECVTYGQTHHGALNMLGLYTDLGGDHKQFGLLTNDRDHLDEDVGVEADPDDGEDEGEETRGQGVSQIKTR